MYFLETNKISKKYKDNYVVKDVSMHVEKGDIYGFVGENGAGKTTVIRLITGLISPTDGGYSICGVDSGDRNFSSEKRKISGIVETVSLNKGMTALENMKFQNILSGGKKTDQELISLIEKTGLHYKFIEKKKAGNFSLGMRQRLGIAMTLVSDPEFIILDEPMNGLDPQGFIEVRETILNLNKEGVTFLISSHILAELEKICTKIGIISKGKLIEELTLEELHDKSRKKIAIRCDETEAVRLKLSSELGLKDSKTEGDNIFIFDDININAVIKVLAEKNLDIKGINVEDETVEDYYLSLMRGKNND